MCMGAHHFSFGGARWLLIPLSCREGGGQLLEAPWRGQIAQGVLAEVISGQITQTLGRAVSPS